MKVFRYSRVLIAIIAIGLIAALAIDFARSGVEQQNTRVDLAIDYEGLQELAQREGLPEAEVLQAAKDAGMQVCGETDDIRLDGRALYYKAVRHVMLNKPSGVLTAARDKKQKTVMDLLPPMYAAMGAMPAGPGLPCCSSSAPSSTGW